MRFYFAHPISSYRSCACRSVISDMEEMRHTIVNSTDHIDTASCDACIFMAFPDEKVAADVAADVQKFLDRGAMVYEVDQNAELGVFYVHRPSLPAERCLDQAKSEEYLRYYCRNYLEKHPGPVARFLAPGFGR